MSGIVEGLIDAQEKIDSLRADLDNHEKRIEEDRDKARRAIGVARKQSTSEWWDDCIAKRKRASNMLAGAFCGAMGLMVFVLVVLSMFNFALFAPAMLLMLLVCGVLFAIFRIGG